MLKNIAQSKHWSIYFTEDSDEFNEKMLSKVSSVIWLSTTGNLLNDEQKNAFKNYVEQGGGFVGIHGAVDTEHHWPWYGNVVGAYFKSHPKVQTAQLVVEDKQHPQHLPDIWDHTDEWYNFDKNPRTNVKVLLSIDETTYHAGVDAMGDHPIAWQQNIGKDRAFYTALGHTHAAYKNSKFIKHIEGAVTWAGRL
nr:hypothetical protein BCU57_07315 [Shewanella sp. 10N.286.48.B5]